jgi:hypothetical protein
VLFYRQYKKYEQEAEKEEMIEKFLNPWLFHNSLNKISCLSAAYFVYAITQAKNLG